MSNQESVLPFLRSQSPEAAPSEAQADTPAAAPPSAGQLLRQAREASGLHISALAVALKVPVRKIQQIEADAMLAEHELVFTRALVGSICRQIKADPRPILQALPQGRRTDLADLQDEGLKTPFHAPGYPATGWKRQLGRPVAWLVVLLLLGAAAMWFWPPAETQPAPALLPSDSKAEAPAPAALDLPSNAASAVTTPAAVAPLLSVTPAAPAPAPASASVPATAPVPAAAVALAPAPAPSILAPASADAAVQLKSRGSAWVEVQDAKANVLLRKTLVAGEQVDLRGPAPLAVVLGRADQMEVQVRGQVWNLARFTHDNVARFEVRP